MDGFLCKLVRPKAPKVYPTRAWMVLPPVVYGFS